MSNRCDRHLDEHHNWPQVTNWFTKKKHIMVAMGNHQQSMDSKTHPSTCCYTTTWEPLGSMVHPQWCPLVPWVGENLTPRGSSRPNLMVAREQLWWYMWAKVDQLPWWRMKDEGGWRRVGWTNSWWLRTLGILRWSSSFLHQLEWILRALCHECLRASSRSSSEIDPHLWYILKRQVGIRKR